MVSPPSSPELIGAYHSFTEFDSALKKIREAKKKTEEKKEVWIGCQLDAELRAGHFGTAGKLIRKNRLAGFNVMHILTYAEKEQKEILTFLIKRTVYEKRKMNTLGRLIKQAMDITIDRADLYTTEIAQRLVGVFLEHYPIVDKVKPGVVDQWALDKEETCFPVTVVEKLYRRMYRSQQI